MYAEQSAERRLALGKLMRRVAECGVLMIALNRHGVRLRHWDLVNGGARHHPASIPGATFLHTNQTLYLTDLIGVRLPCLVC
jgi:hypothetical protein